MNFFRNNKNLTDPETIISGCLSSLLNRISDDLERKGYYWDASWGVKRYESIILSKFIVDHSFESVMREEASEEEKSAYYFLSNKIFMSLFDGEFSEIGMNYESMKSEIDKKIKDYFAAYNSTDESPDHYAQMYMVITRSKSPDELKKEINKQSVCLKFLQVNDKFSHMVPEYEKKLMFFEEKASAFKLAEIMLPHMMRSARHKVKDISIKKLKSLSKKNLKKENK